MCCSVRHSQPVSTGRGKTTATIPQKLCFSPQCAFIKALTLQQAGCGQQMCLSVFTEFLVGVTPRGWICAVLSSTSQLQVHTHRSCDPALAATG